MEFEKMLQIREFVYEKDGKCGYYDDNYTGS